MTVGKPWALGGGRENSGFGADHGASPELDLKSRLCVRVLLRETDILLWKCLLAAPRLRNVDVLQETAGGHAAPSVGSAGTVLALAGRLVRQDLREGLSTLLEEETPNFQGRVGWPNPEPVLSLRWPLHAGFMPTPSCAPGAWQVWP